MPIKKSQQSFSGGEVSSSLHGRTDLAKYHVALKTARNAHSHKHGGISNRAGFGYVGDTGDHDVVARLIPFEFNTDQTYSLEFGDLTMRVIKDGAYVIDSGSPPDIYELVTTYEESDLALLKFTQSADVMTITHPDFDPRELSRTDHDVWSIDDVVFGPTAAAPTGGIVGSTEDVSSYSITGITQANPGVVSEGTDNVLSDGDTYCISDVVGMTEVNGKNFKANKVSIKTYQMVGVDSSAYTAYSSGGTIYTQAKYYKYKVVAIDDDTKEASLPLTITSSPLPFPLTDTAHNVISWVAAAGASKYDVFKEDNGFYGYIGTAEGLSFVDDNILPDFSDTPQEEQDPFSGADDKPGCVAYDEQRRVFGRTNNKRQTVFGTQTGNHNNMNTSFPVKDDDAYEFTIAARQVNEIRHLLPVTDLLAFTSGGVWKLSGGGDQAITPSNILVKNQSSIGASDVPPVLAGDYILFAEDGNDILNEIDYSLERDKYVAVDRTLLASHLFESDQIKEMAFARKPENIVWCVMTSGKLLGMTYIPDQDVWGWHWHETDGLFESICSIREGTEDAVYVIVKRTIGGVTKRFAERLHTRYFADVRDCFFVDSGLSLDVPLTITGITQADPAVVTIAAHGKSNGDYLDLSDITGMTELNDKQFKIKNVTANTLELTDADDVNIDSTSYTEYSSGGYAREAVLSISGLDHLEGKEVSVLANGNVVSPNPTVTSGAITLTNRSSRVHVGLGYISDIETLDIDTVDGRMTAKKINVGEVKVNLLKSRGMWAGPDANHLTEWKQRGIAGEDYGEATALFTGEATMGVVAMWRDGGGTLIRQQYPLPLTVLAIVPKVSLGG